MGNEEQKAQESRLEKLHQIFDLVFDVNLETKHQSFFYIYPHVQDVRVEIFENGWKPDKENRICMSAYYNDMESTNDKPDLLCNSYSLQAIINVLKAVLDGTLDFSKYQ